MIRQRKHAGNAGKPKGIGKKPGLPMTARITERNPASAYREMLAANMRFLQQRAEFLRAKRSGKKLVGSAMESALASQRLRKQLLSDPKFGIENDAAFNERLFRFLRSAKAKKPFSFAIVDLDGLKWLNDAKGYDVGDRALSQLAAGLNRIARQHGGFAGRFGGDEFKILLPKGKAILSTALKSVLQEMQINGFSFSAGICSSLRVAGLSREQEIVEKLNILSENALKLGKKSGKGKISVAD